MDEALTNITEWLLCASSQVGDQYFQPPVAGTDPEEAKYRERVYCYELYHRWRCHWPDGFPYTLSGEVDKAGHPLIPGGSKPDFLVHVPGKMENLLIVEVKPATETCARMADDLKKLTKFRRDLKDQVDKPGNYGAAYFWVYGVGPAGWRAIGTQLLQEVDDSPDFDRSLVSCFVHERPGLRGVRVPWAGPG